MILFGSLAELRQSIPCNSTIALSKTLSIDPDALGAYPAVLAPNACLGFVDLRRKSPNVGAVWCLFNIRRVHEIIVAWPRATSLKELARLARR